MLETNILIYKICVKFSKLAFSLQDTILAIIQHRPLLRLSPISIFSDEYSSLTFIEAV